MLYKGVFGAASGAGLAIGTYFAFYGAAKKLLERYSDYSVSRTAFLAGRYGRPGFLLGQSTRRGLHSICASWGIPERLRCCGNNHKSCRLERFVHGVRTDFTSRYPGHGGEIRGV